MNTFKYYYYLYANKEKSSLEIVFEDLIKKIELYEKQYKITLKLYKSELSKELKKLLEEYEIEEKKEKVNYDQAYADTEVEGEDEQMRHSYANHVSGLEVLYWEYQNEKDNITSRYLDFFDLYCKSLMTALYSLVESKLKEICDIIADDFGQKIKYEHLDSRDYLNASINYLDLVIQLPVVSLEPFISKLKDIQFIRNRIIHTQSKFTGDNEKTISEIVKKSNGALELTTEKSASKLRLKKTQYILDFFELIREFFEELFWLIDIKQEKKILKKGLKFWFGILDNKIFIKNIELKKIGQGKRNINFDLSSMKRSIPKFKCKVTISRASENSLEIIDQTNIKAINEFNELVDKAKSFMFDYVFELFNQSQKGIRIEVIMF